MATKIYYPPTTLIGTANVGETKTLNTAGKLTESNIKIVDDYEYYDGSLYYPHLCFTANTAGSTVAMSVNGTPTLGQNFQYSTDGSTWNTFTPGTTTVTLNSIGNKVYFKGDNSKGISQDYSTYYNFILSGSIASSGNIMSLIDNGACSTLTIPNSYCFKNMFYNCTSLVSAPTLPATTLAENCYYSMFYGCTSLTSAPALPATTLTASCYSHMFTNCSSLTTAPELPATTLENSCYSNMFESCTSLTTAPTLSATTLAQYCCYAMFNNCTSLTIAPALHATTLGRSCYWMMFYNCNSLIVSDTSGSGYTNAWRIPTSGTFTNTESSYDVFYGCATGSGRASNDMAGESGQSYTYYTQNTPAS